jgi:hypothetical protein
MRPPSPDAIAAIASRIAFGRPIVQNNLRALVAEVIVGAALGSTWQHCSGGWQRLDFEHETGVRLEVKQSARQQTWAATGGFKCSPSFDVRERAGYWERGTTGYLAVSVTLKFMCSPVTILLVLPLISAILCSGGST